MSDHRYSLATIEDLLDATAYALNHDDPATAEVLGRAAVIMVKLQSSIDRRTHSLRRAVQARLGKPR